jgi:hypothetical protein
MRVTCELAGTALSVPANFFIGRSLFQNLGDAMSFGLYAIGFAIMIGGLIYGAHLMHMPTHWIAVGAIVLLGVGILSGVKATRQKDSAE